MQINQRKIRNILHIIDKFSMDGKHPSSCAFLFRDWHRCYDRSRFHVVYCGLKEPDPGSRMLETEGLELVYLNHGKYSPANFRGIMDVIRSRHIDLLHLHGYSSANFGRLAAWRTGIPAVLHEHAALKVRPHQFVMDFLLRRLTDHAIVVSRSVREFAVTGRSIPPERISVIYNSVDLDRFKPVSRAAIRAFRDQFHVPAGHRLVGTVTRLRQEKGNRYLLQAVPAVLSRFPQTTFLLIGDGPEMEALRQLAHHLSIENRVTFTGFYQDIPLALGALDVKVMPSLTEGSPYALIEAMAAGRAIVATRVGGIAEMMTHEEDCLLVPPRDPEGLAEGIGRVLADTGLAIRLGEEAKRRSRRFSVDRIVSRHEAVYEAVLSRQR